MVTSALPTASAKPTLEMVAAEAGVSRSTVSRVVNESPKVTAEAIAAVSAAIEKLGYVPNRAARILAGRRTFAVALIIPENTAKFFADPYFATVVQGVAVAMAKTEYTLTLLIAGESEREKTRRFLRSGSIDGAIVLSHHHDDVSYTEMAQSLPLVFGGRPMSTEGDDVVYVDVDNVTAARGAAELLLSRGRRRLATIAGPQDMSAGIDRLTGWRQALAASGGRDDLVEVGDFTPASGAAAMRRLLESGEQFDGLFVASSQMASGAVAELRAHGIRIPDDVGVIAFDDDYFAETSVPPLTTVAQPTTEVGAGLAALLLRRVDGEDVPGASMLPTTIVDRGSA